MRDRVDLVGFSRALLMTAVLSLGAVGCGTSNAGPAPTGTAQTGTAQADRAAGIIGQAIAFPRQPDAASLARRALAIWKGSGELAVLEATDLHPTDASQPAARLVLRIHVPAVENHEVFAPSHPAYDACYRLEYAEPSSSLVGGATPIGCPVGAAPVVLPAPPHVDHLPADAAARLSRVLSGLPASTDAATVRSALRAAFPTYVVVDAKVDGQRIAGAVSVPHPNEMPDCQIAIRDGGRVASAYPADPVVLMPGESGCVADLALHPVVTH